MTPFQRQIVAVALLAAVSASALFYVRGDLADSRASVGATEASRDHIWNNYLLAEKRGTAATVLVASGTPLGITEAVAHMRGAFVAIAAAADEKVPEDAFDLLGANGPPLLSPLALDLARNGSDAYNSLKEQIAPLQNKVLTKFDALRDEIGRLEGQIGLFTYLETLAFLLTVVSALLLNVLGARRGSE